MEKIFLLSFVTSFLILTFLYADASDDLQGSAKGWKAGVIRVVITPEQSMWMAGYVLHETIRPKVYCMICGPRL